MPKTYFEFFFFCLMNLVLELTVSYWNSVITWISLRVELLKLCLGHGEWEAGASFGGNCGQI